MRGLLGGGLLAGSYLTLQGHASWTTTAGSCAVGWPSSTCAGCIRPTDPAAGRAVPVAAGRPAARRALFCAGLRDDRQCRGHEESGQQPRERRRASVLPQQQSDQHTSEQRRPPDVLRTMPSNTSNSGTCSTCSTMPISSPPEARTGRPWEGPSPRVALHDVQAGTAVRSDHGLGDHMIAGRRACLSSTRLTCGVGDARRLGREETGPSEGVQASEQVRSGGRITDTRLVGGRHERMPLRRVP
jgi:hypothetical protein